MGLSVAGLETLDRHVRVDLGGRGGGMTEDLLDAAQVGAALEQVGRRAVADAVRAGIPGRSRLALAARARSGGPCAGPGGRRGPRGTGPVRWPRWPAPGAPRGQPAVHRG